MLHASPDLLPSLYDGSPKVLVATPRDRPSRFVPPADAMRWFVAETADGAEFTLSVLDGGAAGDNRRRIELPPTNVWAVWSPESTLATAGLAEWWSRTGGSGAEPIFVNGDAAMLRTALIERSLAEVSRLTRLNQMLIEDLAALRESWTQAIRLPPELEELLANLRAAPPRLVFETPAADGDVLVPAAVPAGGAASPLLRQRLPMGARGFLGIDLRAAAPGNGDGFLEVALVILETEAEMARWRAPYRDLGSGWLPLRLPAASALTWRGLELRIHASGGTAAPRLACAPVGLLGEYACSTPAGDAPSGAMLEFKLWGGVPDLKPPAGPGLAALPANPVIAIPEQVVATARSTRELSWAYPYFGYLDRGRVLLRPLKTSPASAACITLPAKPGLTALSCEATIDDGLCKTRLLTRLVATRPGHSADDAEQGVGVLASSEWVELTEPLKPFSLTARLPQPESGPVDLHFLSRLPEGGKLDHGRVVFGRFEAELDEQAAWKRASIMPEATLT
ncbi:hypothetical protein ARD30_02355 [Bosea thiooxidans]|uniref:Uncharacterized protein n=1 Tax=Bosea thiooxidans TaxID=53254 RepID=A0A0Q3T203_9HYPH|nr:DUF6212 domain-containing protein [Bosea thiooxidans]KQK31746.1 hypothetical protein ARD30_02355 [Bosea thiooxidans]SKB57577.1 hypothetical protein SAMN05660750_01342 [Bosea thiooxidans]